MGLRKITALKRPKKIVRQVLGFEGIKVPPPRPKRPRVNSRRKGIKGELEARNLWREFYPDCQRSFGQARKGYEQPDLIGGGIEKEWYIEVKRPHRKPSYDQVLKWSDKLVDDFDKYGMRNVARAVKLLLMWRHDGDTDWIVHYRWPEDLAWDYISWDKFRKNILLNGRSTPPTDSNIVKQMAQAQLRHLDGDVGLQEKPKKG